MKKILTGVALAALLFAACSKENPNGVDTGGAEGTVAYLSLKVNTQAPNGVRSSDEHPGVNESDLNDLYLVTFDANEKVVKIPASNKFYIHVANNANNSTPAAQKISAKTKKVVVIANAGPMLVAVLDNMSTMSTSADLRAAIAGLADADEIHGTQGFTMITCPSDAGLSAGDYTATPPVPGDKISTPCIDCAANVVEVTTTDAAAKTEAETNKRLTVSLERLVSKMMVYAGTPNVDGGATFALTEWTVDAVNSTFFPFAEKTLIGVAHTAGKYASNFYTEDPNFVDNTGIVYTTVDPDTKLPSLLWNKYYDWKAASTDLPGKTGRIAYTPENTMAAAEQRYKNATRIVMRATFFPKDFTAGQDWFSWANKSYKTLAELQADYAAAPAAPAVSPLRDACDAFYSKVKAFAGTAITATKFADLTQAMLDAPKLATVGGEVAKNGTDAVIRWYQKGQCYYYYEIRHDNSAEATKAYLSFAKYGVVRNNWYNLYVNNVSGPGTPWYPDVNNPGEGDPDPNDPIDDKPAYLGVTVEVQPWIIWESGMNL